MKRSAFALFVVAGAALTAAGCSRNGSGTADAATYKPRLQPTEVEVAQASFHPISSEIKFTGNLLPRKVTRVVSEVEGIVAEVPQVGVQIDVVSNGRHYNEQLGITYGQAVRQGDILVQLDTSDEEVALQIAQAKLQKAQADLNHLQAWERPEEVRRLTALRDEAQARLEQAQQHYRRMEPLHQRNAISTSELEKAATEVTAAQATLAGAEAMLAKAQAGPTAEELNIQKALVAQAEAEVEQHRRKIQKGSLRAPYDGVITTFQVEVGDRVSPAGDPIAEIMDVSYLSAEIAVPEKYIGQIEVHDRATVHAAGANQPVAGIVIAVNDRVDPQTRTFSVRVAIDNEQRRFKAGQFATVAISLGDEKTNRLAVPSRAIVLVEGSPHVFTVQDNRVQTRPVQLGLSSASMTEVVDGLTSGDLIVVDDPSLLADQMAIEIKNPVTEVASR